MPDRPRIVIAEAQDFSSHVVQSLRAWADVDLGVPASLSLRQALATYDVYWFRLAHRIDATVLDENSRCRVLVTPVTGIDHIDENLCTRLGVRILCLRGEVDFLREVRATAELTIALTLALLRQLPQAYTSVLGGHWDRDQFRGRELYRKVAGIIGYGRLGSITADYFQALGMQVIAYDPKPVAVREGMQLASSPEEVMRQADVISLHVNYHSETHGLIGDRLLRLVKPGAILINTSRGGLIDEAALLSALQEKRLAGAALDVLSGEPAITDHPLLAYARTHDNLLLVPHIGGNTHESFAKTETFMAKRLAEHFSIS